MRNIVAGHEAADEFEFAELALGIDTELFTGPTGGESTSERAARLAAAHDILNDLMRTDPDLADHAARLLAEASTDPFIDITGSHVAVLLGGTPRMGKAGLVRLLGRVAA
ncbi:hypothetical protein [Streptacidiphilus carbonis]|uniref:hypothetical protein n=1 Tax=Streptacidiphilus carbonis TaxID=105422 RepID=UPI0007C7DBF1|nr:hypothetical protein [Streptacidiphilus carbonis]